MSSYLKSANLGTAGWNWGSPVVYLLHEEYKKDGMVDDNGEIVACDGHYLLDEKNKAILATRYAEYTHGQGFTSAIFPPGSWTRSSKYAKWLPGGLELLVNLAD